MPETHLSIGRQQVRQPKEDCPQAPSKVGVENTMDYSVEFLCYYVLCAVQHLCSYQLFPCLASMQQENCFSSELAPSPDPYSRNVHDFVPECSSSKSLRLYLQALVTD
jgi:hypothetical protein